MNQTADNSMFAVLLFKYLTLAEMSKRNNWNEDS